MLSVSNRQLTLLRKLGQKKYRQKEQLFIVEGERAVEQVVENGLLTIQHLFFDEEQRLWETNRWESLDTLPSATIGKDYFKEITDTENPQGIFALCAMPAEMGLDRIAASEGTLVAVDRIQDPGNLGAIIRTSAWFGIKGLLLGKGSVDLFHPKVVRSTAGATGSIFYRYSELPGELNLLQQEKWEIILLDSAEAAMPLKEVSPRKKQVVVVGNEANGIGKELFGPGRAVAKIEGRHTSGGVESLNASIALSIALYVLSG